MFRTLETRYEGKQRRGVTAYPLPDEDLEDAPESPPGFKEVIATGAVWKRILERVMFSAASYEMLGGALVDGIVLDIKNEKATYVYYICSALASLFECRVGHPCGLGVATMWCVRARAFLVLRVHLRW